MKSLCFLSFFFILFETNMAKATSKNTSPTPSSTLSKQDQPSVEKKPAGDKKLLVEKNSTSSLHLENQGKRAKLVISETESVVKFQIEALQGLALSFDAPWSLKLKSGSGIDFKTSQLTRKDFEPDLPGFKVQATKKSSNLQFDYDLTAFICLADKTQCFREVLKGTAKLGS